MTEDNLDLNTEEPIYTEADNIIVSETPFYTFDWYIKWVASVFYSREYVYTWSRRVCNVRFDLQYPRCCTMDYCCIHLER